MKKLLLLLITAVFLSGCATVNKADLLSVGMTRAEVVRVMGDPASSKEENSKETLEYLLRPAFDPNSWDSFCGDKVRFLVILENGKVVRCGKAGPLDEETSIKQ